MPSLQRDPQTEVEESTSYKHRDLTADKLEDISLDETTSLYARLSSTQDNLIIFWSTWCPHCKPVLEKISSDTMLSDVALGIAEDTDAKGVEKMTPSFATLTDSEWSLFNKYDLNHIPSLFVVDGKGTVLGSAEGEEACLELIEECLANRANDSEDIHK